MLRFRTAVESDMFKVMDIRNNPEVMKGYYTQKKPLTKEEHMNWWYSRNSDWMKGIIELDGEVIGMWNIGQMDYWEPECAVSIIPQHWGKGYGKQTVREMLAVLKVQGKQYSRTTILDDNERSKRLFKSLGFFRVGDARPGESLYRREL
jgi:RimJ/RimL family protein N-acetyltransferase